MKRALFVVYFFALAQIGIGQSIKILRARDMQIITLDSMAADLAKARVVFFGEEHDDSLGHQVQYQLMQRLYQFNPEKLTLSLEMFETDCQVMLDEYLAGFINEDRFLKDSRPWPNYKDHYRPLVELAKTNRLPVLAANAPRRYVNLVSRRSVASLDSLGREAKKWLPPPLPYQSLEGAYYEKFSKVMGGHAAGMQASFYQSQNLWDASMAYYIVQHLKQNKKRQVYHLCGRFHSDHYLGTVAHLRREKPKWVVKTVSCMSAKSHATENPNDLVQIADYLIITGI
jgi:uncharacterized iron-regulated protein